ncbi:Os01g0709750 [Oryza sativa Japonica Group]|uniref:Os01g0709750 protein n=1 Tax=Oryza sativa subsp. japonica TaxID=39947 RepID=A0A0N7KDL7_ORYSJ|nr:Os01g0709750 [Oryza sativa Japonica Group]
MWIGFLQNNQTILTRPQNGYRVCSALPVPNFPLSFSSRTLFKLLNGVFFAKSFYTKVALKNHIDPFLKKKLILN